jgi:hypothetical protein
MILEAGLAVESAGLRIPRHEGGNGFAPGPFEPAALEALRQENEQLKELVIQLTKIVVRNVMDSR